MPEPARHKQAEQVLDALSRFDFPLQDIWVSAARFHFHNLDPEISRLPPGARVLEIGCGAGILMTMLQRANPTVEIEGIEPLEEGFDGLADLKRHFLDLGAKIGGTGYESCFPDRRYDLVYLVNVLEHLKDWRHFLDILPRFLAPGGRCLILCPNYGFPFEPHFNRPVIGSKAFMRRLYRARIDRIERSFGMQGLWDSLNFVRLSEIKRHVADLPLDLTVRAEISDRMLARFSTDAVFREHLTFVGHLARAFRALGGTGLFRFEILENLQPYMFLDLLHAPRGANGAPEADYGVSPFTQDITSRHSRSTQRREAVNCNSGSRRNALAVRAWRWRRIGYPAALGMHPQPASAVRTCRKGPPAARYGSTDFEKIGSRSILAWGINAVLV